MTILPLLLLAALDPAVVDRLAKASLDAWKTPGAAIAIITPERTYLQGYGVRRLGSADAVTAKTVFAIGSATKAFTSAAVGMLVDEGRLNWDDPARKHLPEFRLSDAAANELATVRDLLSHRTGLARNDALWYGSPWSREEILDRVGRVPLTKPFRSAWQYQNIMFLAAGQIVARVSGAADWEEFVQRRILDPLQMRDTSFTPADAERRADHASPHAKRKGRAEAIAWRNLDNIGPAGAINSNVEDLAKWVRLQMDGGEPLLRAATLAEMHAPQMAMRREDWGRNFTDESNQMAYGLGWFLSDYRGRQVVHHGGAIDGFRAQITMLPKEKLGIVVLANLGADNMPEALRWKIADHLLGAPDKDWDSFLIDRDKTEEGPGFRRIEGTKPSLPLAAYAGDYANDAYGIARVGAAADSLRLAWAAERVTLEHFHFDTFAVRDARLEGYVPFSLNAAGDSARLQFQGVEFRRIGPALDAAATAALFVKALKLGKGERVIVRYDPAYLRELAAPIEAAVRKAGGVASALPYGAKGAPAAGCGDFAKALDVSTVYLWMPFDEARREVTDCETLALTKWLDAGGARRQIHFHWSGGSVLADGLPAEHQPEFDHVYAKALDVDYARMSQEQDRAAAALRAGTVRVRSPGGTDLSFRIGERPFNKQDGDASAERMKGAKVRVDREVELPAGVLRVAPLEETANGVIAVASARFGSAVARELRLTIRGGRVTGIAAASGKEAVERALSEGGEAALRFREFGLGFNPRLTAPTGSKILPYFAYGSGMVRLSLGGNEELGGAVRGSFRRWFFFADATVEVDGRVVSRPR